MQITIELFFNRCFASRYFIFLSGKLIHLIFYFNDHLENLIQKFNNEGKKSRQPFLYKISHNPFNIEI